MWFGLSLACAFLAATTATLTKTVLKDNDAFVIGWLRQLLCLPILAAIFIIIPKPTLDITFWRTVLILLPLELTAFLLYLKSIKISPLSLTFPFLGLTPVFSVLFAHLILKEKIGSVGMLGIAIVALGVYLLNANAADRGILEPLKRIYREKGSILMIITAFIYSITSTLGKKCVMMSSPVVFPVIYFPAFLVLFTIFIIFWSKRNPVKLRLNKKLSIILVISSLTFVAAILLHFKAISMIQAPYMISVKRTSLIFSVIYGGIIFKEKNLGYRLIGVFVMLIGIALIATQ